MRYLFVIDLPELYKKKIKDLQDTHRADRWKIMIDPHITLAISTETDLDTKEAKDLLKVWEAHREPFEIGIKGLRQFRNSRVRVIYAAVQESKSLRMLRHNLVERLGEIFSLQNKEKFTPHITISNRLTSEEARRVMKKLKKEDLDHKFVVRSISMYKKGPKDKKWKLLAEKWLG